jgi:hypothetical protein
LVHFAQRKAKAEAENQKVQEVAFLNRLTQENKKARLRMRHEASEGRRAQALEDVRVRARSDGAEAATARRRMIELARSGSPPHTPSSARYSDPPFSIILSCIAPVFFSPLK